MAMYGKFHKEYFDYVHNGVEPDGEAKKIVFEIIARTTNVYNMDYEFEDTPHRIQEILIENWIEEIKNVNK